eukprot:7701698-Karenia_brevis.AAC.1
MEVDQVVYSKYKAELYGVLVPLTTEERLRIMRGLQDTKFKYDGYMGIVALRQRYDVRASSSMLSSFLEVVVPKGAQEKDLVPGVQQWESKVADLKTTCGEEIKGILSWQCL